MRIWRSTPLSGLDDDQDDHAGFGWERRPLTG